MRVININDEKLLKILNEHAALNKKQEVVIAKLREIEVETKELEEDFKKNMAASERIMEKAQPLLKKFVEANIEFGEFEEVSRVPEVKNEEGDGTGEWTVEIANRMDEFKAAWENKMKEKLEAETNEVSSS